jgi:glycosyltransferase involved in cell wall biosynthesis
MNSRAEFDLPDNATSIVQKSRAAPTFLMVGTMEPRKGHQQTLAAFETLWAQGVRANLVIVGKQGWRVEDLVQRLRNHPELGTQLHWLESVSDEYLEVIYSVSSCLIAASEGEGFGLPLIEAAQHHLPIIARDLLVFREIAGAHAFYFNGLKPGDLAEALIQWLKLYEVKSHVQSSGMNWLTWAQSTKMLLARLGIGTESANPCGLPEEARAGAAGVVQKAHEDNWPSTITVTID